MYIVQMSLGFILHLKVIKIPKNCTLYACLLYRYKGSRGLKAHMCKISQLLYINLTFITEA